MSFMCSNKLLGGLFIVSAREKCSVRHNQTSISFSSLGLSYAVMPRVWSAVKDFCSFAVGYAPATYPQFLNKCKCLRVIRLATLRQLFGKQIVYFKPRLLNFALPAHVCVCVLATLCEWNEAVLIGFLVFTVVSMPILKE